MEEKIEDLIEHYSRKLGKFEQLNELSTNNIEKTSSQIGIDLCSGFISRLKDVLNKGV